MAKILFCFSVLIISLIKINAQSKWSVNPINYQYSMTFTTLLIIDNEVSKDTNDLIGAFVNDICQGVARPLPPFPNSQDYVAYLMVYSNNIEGDTLTFKLYDADKDIEVELFNHVPFQPNAYYGSPVTPLQNIVEKKITAYNFFSPNNDGINDEWKIVYLPLYYDFKVLIYNSIGEKVFSVDKNYRNDWKGTYEGQEVPDGTYYYIVISPNEEYVYKGIISLIR